MQLRIDSDPRTVTFLIYSVPITSTPVGALHRIRVWLKSLVTVSANAPTALPFHDSYVYQRLWKTDAFKLGARLDFEGMASAGKIMMGFAAGPPQMVAVPAKPTTPTPSITSSVRILDEKMQRG
ncbi:hypothetical protein H0H81_005930, partial [Sphagnurus paluster]